MWRACRILEDQTEDLETVRLKDSGRRILYNLFFPLCFERDSHVDTKKTNKPPESDEIRRGKNWAAVEEKAQTNYLSIHYEPDFYDQLVLQFMQNEKVKSKKLLL